MANFVANARQQAVVGDLLIAFMLMHDDFHHFQQVEHGDVVQPVGPAWNRQLDAAHHRVVARVFQRHAAVKERRNHHFVVEDLRNAGAEAYGLGGFAQKRTVDQFVDPHAEVRLRQAHVLVGIQTGKGEHVHRAAAIFG